MSRIVELEDEIKELENRRIELLKELEVEKIKENAFRYPFEYGEYCYYLHSCNKILRICWRDDDSEQEAHKQGNIFKTKNEAQKEKERRELLTYFRQIRNRCNGDWKPESDKIKYYICLKGKNPRLIVSSSIYWDAFNMFGYFKNEQDCERAIELFGDEIKRLFLEEE